VNGNGRTWPLLVIAAPAAVAIWSGWVGLGGLAGFGVVNLLPGIGAGFRLNTAITLPVRVEAYAAYALGAWMSPGSPDDARKFAKWSALGALGYGMAGQVIYHLLAAAHVTVAPWPVTVAVSCMPVAVLGFAAALTHLLRQPEDAENEPASVSGPVSAQPPRKYSPPGQRAIMTTVGVGQPKAKRVQRLLVSEVKAASNGHGGTP
jgi:hypothetical protein